MTLRYGFHSLSSLVLWPTVLPPCLFVLFQHQSDCTLSGVGVVREHLGRKQSQEDQEGTFQDSSVMSLAMLHPETGPIGRARAPVVQTLQATVGLPHGP